jgi:hypothetical protein
VTPINHRDRIAAALRGADPASTVVLAGHFAIYTAGGRAADLLDDPLATQRTDMVEFARQSWIAGCDAVAAAPAMRLLVLVDDIQFVRPALPDRGARERLAAALAADYVRRTPTLPSFHLREMDERALGRDQVLRRRDDGWLFSERALRGAAVHRIRDVAAPESAFADSIRAPGESSLVASADASRIVVRDPVLGEHTLVHSGNTSCAGGYLELVAQLHDRGITRLVAIVPRRCLGPVTMGTHLARTMFGATGIEVVNIPSDGEAPAPEPALRTA